MRTSSPRAEKHADQPQECKDGAVCEKADTKQKVSKNSSDAKSVVPENRNRPNQSNFPMLMGENKPVHSTGIVPNNDFPSASDSFPLSFYNSNTYNMGLLKTVENSNEPPPRMNFESGDYDTCSEYFAQSALTRHSENFYHKNPRPSSSHSHAHSHNARHSTTPTFNTAISSSVSSGGSYEKYRDIRDRSNMSMELTFENSNLYGLAGPMPTTLGGSAKYDTDDHFSGLEPFEMLHYESNASPRQQQQQQQQQHQEQRFRIPLL